MFSSQFRDDKRNNVQFAVPGRQCFLLSQFFLCICHPYFLICHPGNATLNSLSSRKAERSEVYPGSRNQSRFFCLWVPDTVRLATLAHSSGTTKGIMFSSQFRDDSVFCYLNSSYVFVIPEGRAERGLSGIQKPIQIFLLLGPGYCSLHSQFRDDKRNNVQFAVPGRQCFLLSQFFL